LSVGHDEEPVEAFPPNGADPAFGERVRLWRSEWSTDDLDGFAAENIVEGAAELAVTSVDQKAERSLPLGE
jgi:hypothetical protein